MPQKLQLKLLSNSGELLSVVTCQAGKISVLRASVPSDLRPYQRVLSGSSGKENILAVVDGTDYRPDEHTVIGFGEPSTTTGLSVKEFLAKYDVPENAIDSLLLSIGLESVLDKKCSELSADQEARLRLLAATTDPERIVVLNDPFENISGQWRERAADILATFARTRKAVVIIPSLSYRPESWIDNQSVERIEVGQTSQRTIGFGSAGSAHNAFINEIRDRVRQDAQSAAASQHIPPQPENSHNRPAATLSAAAMGAPLAMGVDPSEAVATPSKLAALTKVGSLVVGAGVGVWVAFALVNRGANESAPAPAPTKARVVDSQAANKAPAQPVQPQPAVAEHARDGSAATAPLQPAALNNQGTLHRSPDSPPQFVLDRYPAPIRIALVETAKGVGGYKAGPSQPAVIAAPASHNNTGGNLFSLLEKASDAKPGAGRPDAALPASDEPYSEPAEAEAAYQEPRDMTEEESRREAIRNRFLEAIRAAAEKRQTENEE